jgi:hypothetical protein
MNKFLKLGKTGIFPIFLIISFTLTALGAENTHLSYIRQIFQNEKLSAQQKIEKITTYINNLNFKDIVSIGEDIAKEYGNNWFLDDCYSTEMGILLSKYFKSKVIPFSSFLEEIGNPQRSPAGRDFIMRVAEEKYAVQNQETKKKYYEMLKKIALEREEDPILRSGAIRIIGILGTCPGILPEIPDLMANLMKDSNTNVNILVSTVRTIRSFIQWTSMDQKLKYKLEFCLKEIFHIRQKYPMEIQVETAEALLFTCKDTSILTDLKQMLEETSDKILCSRINDMISIIEHRELDRVLKPPTPAPPLLK